MVLGKLTQLADSVWLWPHNPDENAIQSTVGVIVGEDETILIDAGNSPRLARQIKDELKQRGLPPVGRIIYTHHHWDHIYGACAFDVPVIAHTSCREILAKEAQIPWSAEYLDREIARNSQLNLSYEARKRAVRDWQHFRIVVPNIVFAASETLHLSEGIIELEYVGGEHAEDSIIVKVPEARIMFVGDCFYPPPLHLRIAEPIPSISMLAFLLRDEYDLYVEGHDVPFTKGELLEFLGDG